MTTTAPDAATVDPATVERLSEAFRRCIETHTLPREVFAPDVFADLLPPFWRFQIQGAEALQAQLRAIATGPTTVRVIRTVPTATGFVTEHEETVHGESTEVARHLWLLEVRDGRITEALTYCNGGWDEELRARHAAEAPMLRP